MIPSDLLLILAQMAPAVVISTGINFAVGVSCFPCPAVRREANSVFSLRDVPQPEQHQLLPFSK